MEAIIYICLGFMLICSFLVVRIKSMLKSAVALAAASAALGIIMYVLGSAWAALIEISVCSGLVTVIFISAISLSNTDKKELQKLYEDKKRMAYLPVVLIIGGIIFIFVALSTDSLLPQAVSVAQEIDNFREVLWNNRQADIWAQAIVIIAGAIAVTVLFKEKDTI
ncbi:MAG TPA: hypothetical protein GXX37_00950 [Clostridiaceae bacterium]|nr:hypothetical protein [Clostridiaceae bacterium]